MSRPILSQVEPSCRSKLSAPLHPSPMHIPNPLSEYYSLLCSYAIFEQFKILLHYSPQRPTVGLSSVQTRTFLGANLPFTPSKLPLWTILSLTPCNLLITNQLLFLYKTMNILYKFTQNHTYFIYSFLRISEKYLEFPKNSSIFVPKNDKDENNIQKYIG